ncbi:isochorismatase family protein [Streptomyces sp. NBC_00654]|uniref:isochorismatase family protein n=1 Tax=Streptomyces sp. NBC_00654 TaxID=2975799 RepID=UPI002252FB86|nr:isochorismatase family protein [Streptomyces sp. NBC_00654]MCX4966759.1 isochorismatase family protein [Streptomyces sp. NBC_00654]
MALVARHSHQDNSLSEPGSRRAGHPATGPPCSAEFHPGFAPASEAVDEVLYKGAHSAPKSGFEGSAEDGTSPADWLKVRDITAVDIVGIATDHCVKATALDAVRAGFAAHVLLDYTAGVAADTTHRALGELREAGVSLRPVR